MENTSVSTEPIVTQTYDLTGFTSVCNMLPADVAFTQGPFSVVVKAQQFILDILSVDVKNSQLKFRFTSHAPQHLPISIIISAPVLEGYSLDGTGNFTAQNDLSSSSLSLVVNGAGNINIPSYAGQSLDANISGTGNINIQSGTVPAETLEISGMGSIVLSGVAASTCTTHTSGSGDMKVNVSTTLDVHISGSGNVYYIGNPSVTSKISGSGKVIQQ